MSSETEEKPLDIAETFSKTEVFIEKNKKTLSIVAGALVVLVGGYFGYKKFILEPQEKEAQSQMFVAERYFEMDSLKLAATGDGNYLGFEEIIKQYGITKAANLAHYYLGICYLKTGAFEKAIETLKAYSGEDEITAPLATGAIGDACMELNRTDEAISYYLKAANQRDNEFTTPVFLMKAGLACEGAGKYKDAISAYERIHAAYAASAEGKDIDRFIARAKVQAK